MRCLKRVAAKLTVEEVTIEYSLYNTSNDSDRINRIICEISVDPIGNVECSVCS